VERGYVKFYRKSVESRAFQNEGLWKVWSWCLLKANHKKCWVPVNTGRGETEIKVEPGQFVYGRKTASKELKMPESSIRNRIVKLKKMQNLTVKPDTHYSIITIMNWGIYQSSDIIEDRQKDNQRTGKGQPKDTDKNDKNDKNDKKKENIYTSDFEIFWKTYPLKVGKGGCYKTWNDKKKMNNRPSIEKIISSIEQQKKSERWLDGYVPNPETWLNQGRWDDELPAPLPYSRKTAKNIETLKNWEPPK